MVRKRLGAICPLHGYYNGSRCTVDNCQGKLKHKRSPINGEWVAKTTFEHIDPTNPNMHFDSPKELKKACEARGLLCKALMKDKSTSGRSLEHTRR